MIIPSALCPTNPPPADLSSSTNIIITAPQIHIRTSSLLVRLVSRHGTMHTRDIASKDNTANSYTPDIIVWEAVQLEPCRDVDVGDVEVGCIILA